MTHETPSTSTDLPAWPMTLYPVMHRSFSAPSERLFLPVERPAFTEIITKIDAVEAPRLLPFLYAHGATVEALGEKQRYRIRLPSGTRRIRTFQVYHITFPDGMKQFDGPATRWLVPFTLVFPDRARLDGRINSLPDPAEIILGLPVMRTDAEPSPAS